MSGMEAAIASGLLKIAGDKLDSLIISEFSAIAGVRKDLSELSDTHGEITSLLSTVGHRAIESNPSLPWVMELRNLADDIYDLLDEVHMEDEKHKIGNDRVIAECFCEKPRVFMFRYKLARKIKAIKVTFDAIVKQSSNANAIQQRLQACQPVHRRGIEEQEQTLLSNVVESKIPARDQVKTNIVSKLVESNKGEDSRVISIIGLGGSGKTTLAQHICYEDKIKDHFKDTIFWVHVSQDYSWEILVCKLYEAITKQKSDSQTQQYIHDKILEELKRKKFLLILDDVWAIKNMNVWEQFMKLLDNGAGASGSMILLTTRDEKVANVVKSKTIFRLTCLTEDESWSFFFNNSDKLEKQHLENLDDDLKQVGKDILKKCGGVPLAIKTIGFVLCENIRIETWRAIGESNLWDDKNTECSVFASLKLSYTNLDDRLKQCFTYCSTFPKGYNINKYFLVEQWMAHGFIKLMSGEQPRDIGSGYFDSLVKAGFLQGSLQSGSYKKIGYKSIEEIEVYKMHDLIHDLSRYILQSQVVTSVQNNMDSKHKCRYLSLTSCTEKVNRGLFDKVRALYVSDGNPSFDKHMKKSYNMRSVVLHRVSDAQIPLFILKFEHLGYLEIHNSSCTELPEAISGCWNLQSLHLIRCIGFVTLPTSIGKLKKLRSLELLECADLAYLPRSISDCGNLQSLSIVWCRNMSKLLDKLEFSWELNSLRTLNITDCVKFCYLPSTFTCHLLRTMNLSRCRSLKVLPITFTCPMLHTLNVSETKITELPQWVTMIRTLECLNLERCSDLVELPKGVVDLTKLNVLNILGCGKLHCLPSGIGQLKRLRSLGMFIVGCEGDDARISELEKLNLLSGDLQIKNLIYLKDPTDAEKACLKQKDNIQCLELCWSPSEVKAELVLDMEEDLGVLNSLEPPSQVKKLTIDGYRGPCLPHWMGKETGPCQFLFLTDMRLQNLPNLKCLQGFEMFPSLKTLSLKSVPNLGELWTTTSGFEIGAQEVGEHCCFPVLSCLEISDCPKVTVKPRFPPSLEELELHRSNALLLSTGSSCSVPAELPLLKKLRLLGMRGSSSGWELLRHLPGLESLLIVGSDDMRQLPESMRALTCLKDLSLSWCSTLSEMPEWLGELCALKVLWFYKTPMIASLPQSTRHLRSLEYLRMEHCDNLKQLPDVIQHLTSLRRLSLSKCGALATLPEWIGQLSALEFLDLRDCSALQCLPPSIARLTALKDLRMERWDNLKQLPDVIQHLTSLQELSLSGCSALATLPEWIGQLSALQSLWLHNCSALQCLPPSIARLTALRLLDIGGCPDLVRRYKPGVGDDWHLISRIEHVFWE